MSEPRAVPARRRESLIDAIDRLLDVGTVVSGDAIIRLAEVDLIHLDLRLLLAAVTGPQAPGDSEADAGAATTSQSGPPLDRPERVRPAPQLKAATNSEAGSATKGEAGTDRAAEAPTTSEGERPRDRLDQGLGQLVVAVVELVRQLLERQAVRRMRAGTLDAQQLERLGEALQALEQRMVELRDALGVTPSELDRALGTVEQLLDSSTSDLEGAGAPQRRVS